MCAGPCSGRRDESGGGAPGGGPRHALRGPLVPLLAAAAATAAGASEAERLQAELAELERTAAAQGARIARLREEASAVAEVIGSGARQIEDLIARQEEACAREAEALGRELAPFRAPRFRAALLERRLGRRAAREAHRRGELLLRQARGNATQRLDSATLAALDGLRTASSEVVQTAAAAAARLHVEVAPAAAEVLAVIESFKGAAVREEKCQVQHLGWLRAKLPRPVAVKKRCANRDLYTAWAGCDGGWNGVTFEKCMSLCATNALPRGCHGVPPDVTCAFAVWFSSSGLCHLAKACVLEDSHPDAEVWAAGGQPAPPARCPWTGARGGWWHGGRPLASAEVLNFSDPAACREACCLDHPGCEAFTWWRTSGACHLLQSVRGATWIPDPERTSDAKLAKLADLPAQPFADVRPMFELSESIGDECPVNLAHRGFDGHLGGAFSLMCTVRMDHRNAWSRIFDFAVAPDTQSISAGSVDDSLDLHFTIYRAWSRLSTVVVPGFFELGRESTVLFAVSATGRLSVFKDGLLVGRQDGYTPRWTFRPHLTVGGQSGGHHNYTGQGFRGTVRGVRVWGQEVTWPSHGAVGSLQSVSRLDNEHYCAVVHAERVGVDQVAVEYRAVGGERVHGLELPTNSTLSWEGGLAQVHSSSGAVGAEPPAGFPAEHAAGVLIFSGVPLARALAFEYGCVGYPPVGVALAQDSSPEREASGISDPADSETEASGGARAVGAGAADDAPVAARAAPAACKMVPRAAGFCPVGFYAGFDGMHLTEGACASACLAEKHCEAVSFCPPQDADCGPGSCSRYGVDCTSADLIVDSSFSVAHHTSVKVCPGQPGWGSLPVPHFADAAPVFDSRGLAVGSCPAEQAEGRPAWESHPARRSSPSARGAVFGGRPVNLAECGLSARLGGAFALMCTVRMDRTGMWSRIFDFKVRFHDGDIPNHDSISAGSVMNTTDLHFTVFRGTAQKRLIVRNFFTLGQEDTVLFSVAANGHMKVIRAGEIVGDCGDLQQPGGHLRQLHACGHPPRFVRRLQLDLGGNYLEPTQGFHGSIRDVRVWDREVLWARPRRRGQACEDVGGRFVDLGAPELGVIAVSQEGCHANITVPGWPSPAVVNLTGTVLRLTQRGAPRAGDAGDCGSVADDPGGDQVVLQELCRGPTAVVTSRGEIAWQGPGYYGLWSRAPK